MKTAPLEAVAEINPRGPKPGDFAAAQTFDFVPMADLKEDGSMTVKSQRKFEEVSKGYTAFKNGDVLLAKITPCYENNKIALAEVTTEHAFGSTEFHVIRPMPSRICGRYLTHFLRQDIVRDAGAKRMTGSGGQRRVPKDFLATLEIPLPSLEEQKRIAAILDQADALRRLRARALDRINALGHAIFNEMFVAHGGSQRESWPQSRIGDLCERVSVGVVVKPASYYVERGVPAIRGTNIKPDGIDLSDMVYFDRGASEGVLRKSRLSAGDVVAVRSGRPGLAAVVPPELDGANSIDILIASPKRAKLLPQFLRDFMNSTEGRKIVMAESRGQVQQHFNVKSLSEAQLSLPPIGDQVKYVQRIEAVDLVRAGAALAQKRAEELFNSLQQQAFSGKLVLTKARSAA
ncbi:Type I restriction-modification system, specificity subunit S [Rhodobacter sp. AKP1]|nr:Type I restriction-modification system, specificity subunit S [Rhodobacter sp. AKP1]